MWVGRAGVFKVRIQTLAMLIAVMMNKTFIRHVNIVRNVSHDHQHVHIHGVDVDHFVIIIIGYVLLGVSLLLKIREQFTKILPQNFAHRD